MIWQKNKTCCCEWGKAWILLFILQISITIQTHCLHPQNIVQKFCFLPVWIEVNSGAMKWNYSSGSSAPGSHLVGIYLQGSLQQQDEQLGSISASAHIHWTPSLSNSPPPCWREKFYCIFSQQVSLQLLFSLCLWWVTGAVPPRGSYVEFRWTSTNCQTVQQTHCCLALHSKTWHISMGFPFVLFCTDLNLHKT